MKLVILDIGVLTPFLSKQILRWNLLSKHLIILTWLAIFLLIFPISFSIFMRLTDRFDERKQENK